MYYTLNPETGASEWLYSSDEEDAEDDEEIDDDDEDDGPGMVPHPPPAAVPLPTTITNNTDATFVELVGVAPDTRSTPGADNVASEESELLKTSRAEGTQLPKTSRKGAGPVGAESTPLKTFLEDRSVNHKADATHEFDDGETILASLVDKITDEQNEFDDLAGLVVKHGDGIKLSEVLSPTFPLHFEITIYDQVSECWSPEESRKMLIQCLEDLVATITRSMIWNMHHGRIWKMQEIETLLYGNTFETEDGVKLIYGQVIYPEITVSSGLHSKCRNAIMGQVMSGTVYKKLNKMNKENVMDSLLKGVGHGTTVVPVPLTMHSIGNGRMDRLNPLFSARISMTTVAKKPCTELKYCLHGLKRKDVHSEEGKEHENSFFEYNLRSDWWRTHTK